MQKRLLIIALVWCLSPLPLFAADNRPSVFLAVTRLADEDTKEDAWIAMGGTILPLADEPLHSWYWYPRYGKPFFAVVSPVTISDFAIFAVKFYLNISQADPSSKGVQYVEARWDTPTPFTFEGRQFVLFASLKSLEYVKEKTYPKRPGT